MIDNLPAYISIIFILTTILTVGMFFYAFQTGQSNPAFSKLLWILLPVWMIVQAILSFSGFYLKFEAVPPRLLLTGILPALLLIACIFISARKIPFGDLSLKTLTFVHIVRIPVEVVLLWLFQERLVPQLMTFEGRNFDILAGLSAPLIAWLAFRKSAVNRPLLILWNILALGLLFNIVINAVFSFPFPTQQFGFNQPNVALLYFPYIWLPTVVVPIVLFCHLASLYKLLKSVND